MKQIEPIPSLVARQPVVNPNWHFLAGRWRAIVHFIQQVAKTQQPDVNQLREHRLEADRRIHFAPFEHRLLAGRMVIIESGRFLG
jgi:hypothetical protein